MANEQEAISPDELAYFHHVLGRLREAQARLAAEQAATAVLSQYLASKYQLQGEDVIQEQDGRIVRAPRETSPPEAQQMSTSE